ncbi:MAG: polysaccharide biosynthesis protein [Phycisphaerales bacterium]|nr:polysaccharide biosynthesis protein [Phycisphaerales bacterium]
MKMRSFLVGTRDACALAARQLTSLDQPPMIVGIVLIENEPVTQLEGIAVVGAVDRLTDLCAKHEITQAIVTLPAVCRGEGRAISAALHRAGIIERFIPPMDELLESKPAAPTNISVSLGTPKIDLAMLVGRTAHSIDREKVSSIITDKVILVTGAGGSIGSELVRQVASFRPSRIVLMERAENALFEIDRNLSEIYPNLDRVAIMHDVVDPGRTLAHLERHRPDVVFHAAAHKHVPLMEDHPAHAVTNNIFGTKSIADAAVAVGADRFVLISSDKAVNPVNVMGATKRLAEHYTQGLASIAGSGTKLSMVRFGNVLGSACSVLTIWADQIASGRPLTVTDERMTRFFMTIPEAATLVLQAAAMSGEAHEGSGEVFVLDMGEPINIFQLAQRFIRACGFEPVIGRPVGNSVSSRSVPIILSGSRPGEKLHEQLAYDAEELRATAHPGIDALAKGGALSPESVEEMIQAFEAVRSSTSRQVILETIAKYIPTLSTARRAVPAA